MTLVVGTIVLLRSGASLEDWTLVFAAAFASGWYVGSEHRPGRFAWGLAFGVAYSIVAIVLAATHRWWYGPLALILAFGVGVFRQAVVAVRSWRLARS